MVAVPFFFAVTLPFALTDATFALLDDHVTAASVVVSGVTVAFNVAVPLYSSLRDFLFNLMLAASVVTVTLR